MTTRMAATIAETPDRSNGYRYVVDCPAWGRMWLAGLGAPLSGKVGDHGTVAYQVGSFGGLYFWTPAEGAEVQR